jgi:predicted transcriptional regulator
MGVRMKRVIGKRPSMLEPIELLQTKKEESQSDFFTEMEKVFSVASHADALRIFHVAKEGIESSSQAIKELNLTPKRYYTYLKSLIDVGLIEKADGAYRHTTLGKICLKLMDVFQNALGQRDRLDLVDRLSKTKNITLEETEEIMRAVLKDANIAPGERIADFLGPVRMADTWEKVVKDVIEYIDKAEESVYFASQYFDVRVAEVIFRACKRGVKMHLLTSEKDSVTDRLHVVLRSLLLSPRSLKSLFSLFNSPDVNVRYVDLPYTFIVIDRKAAMVEVPQPCTKAFSMGFFFHDERLCKRLIESFDMLWEKGTDVKTIISRSVKGLDDTSD